LLFDAIRTGVPVRVFGDDYPTPDGTCIRDYVHVVDLARAHVLGLERLLAGGESGAFNLGNGSGCSVKQVIQAAERVTGRKVPHQIGPRRAGDPAVLVGTSQKAIDELGWRPALGEIEQIIATAWRWYSRLHKV
jgi:UDP-glucose 4-epimerase